MIEFLTHRARSFREKVDLLDIERQLRSEVLSDRCDSALFSVYHLLISGAVAEAGIEDHLASDHLPDQVRKVADTADWLPTKSAWSGTAFNNTPNIIGSLAFLVVLLFLFEGFCRLVINDAKIRRDLGLRPRERIRMKEILDWLANHPQCVSDKVDAVRVLNTYRNAWHNFGLSDHTISKRGVNILGGQIVPVLSRLKTQELLGDLLDLFMQVNELRNTPSHNEPYVENEST